VQKTEGLTIFGWFKCQKDKIYDNRYLQAAGGGQLFSAECRQINRRMQLFKISKALQGSKNKKEVEFNLLSILAPQA